MGMREVWMFSISAQTRSRVPEHGMRMPSCGQAVFNLRGLGVRLRRGNLPRMHVAQRGG